MEEQALSGGAVGTGTLDDSRQGDSHELHQTMALLNDAFAQAASFCSYFASTSRLQRCLWHGCFLLLLLLRMPSNVASKFEVRRFMQQSVKQYHKTVLVVFDPTLGA